MTDDFDRIVALFKSSAGKSYSLVATNYAIGRYVCELFDAEGEQAVRLLAVKLNSRGYLVKEEFLWDAMRVFRTIKDPETLRRLQGRIGGPLSWNFLVYKCTKAPQGEGRESELYWERELAAAEQALSEIESLSDFVSGKTRRILSALDSLPQGLRQQVEGFLQGLTEQGNDGTADSIRTVLEGPMTLAHIGDIQMCESFTTAGKVVVDPHTGKNERLLDIQRCLSFVVDQAIAHRCRALFCTGDLYEKDNPTPNEVAVLQSELIRCAGHMPVIAFPGNHDLPDSPGDANALQSLKDRPNIHVVERPSILYLEGLSVSETASPAWPQGDCAKLFVVPFPSRLATSEDTEKLSIEEVNKQTSASLRALIETFRTEIDSRVPNILLLHITIAGAEGATNETMLRFDPHLMPADLRGFDYVGIGHIHKAQRIDTGLMFDGAGRQTVAWYGGSLDRVDFGEENDEKGFLLVTLKGREPDVEFVPTPARVFRTLAPEFFDLPDWRQRIEAGTIYRVKGEVSKEQYEALKSVFDAFPLRPMNKLTVTRERRVRDEQMTDSLDEESALGRYLEGKGITGDRLRRCLKVHLKLKETEKGGKRVDTVKPGIAELPVAQKDGDPVSQTECGLFSGA